MRLRLQSSRFLRAIILTVRQPSHGSPSWSLASASSFRDQRDIPWCDTSKIQGGAVRDHTLAWYIERMRWYKRAVEGIAVLMPIEQGPRSVTGRGSL